MFNSVYKAEDIASLNSTILIKNINSAHFDNNEEKPVVVSAPKKGHENPIGENMIYEVQGRHHLKRSLSDVPLDPEVLYEQKIKNAQREAAMIISEAKLKAQQSAMQIEQEAYQRGFEAGERAGVEIGEKKMELLLNDFTQIVQSLAKSFQEAVKKNEGKIIDLAVLMAEKILHQQLTIDSQTILNLCTATLEKAIKNEKLVLKVSTFDLEHVLINREIFNTTVDMENLTITDDPNISRGGCLVITESGSVDGRIETQKEKIKEKIRNLQENTE